MRQMLLRWRGIGFNEGGNLGKRREQGRRGERSARIRKDMRGATTILSIRQ